MIDCCPYNSGNFYLSGNMTDWFIYPVSNYSKISLAGDSQQCEKDKRELRDEWFRVGALRSTQLVLLAHDHGFPHVLLVKNRGNNRWSLPIEYAEVGSSDSVLFNPHDLYFRSLLIPV